MKDGIIKGNGNSRYLKSVADFLTQYPTYEAFAAALTAGTLPVDLNGINEDGWQQIGDLLNKGNLFADPTAAVFADDVAAVPNDGMYYLAMALGAMEQGKGVLLVYATTAEGDPVVGNAITVSGGGGTKTTNDSGAAVFSVSSGSKTVTFTASGFYSADSNSKTVSVETGKISVCKFTCEVAASGNITITTSTTLQVPENFPLCDLFAVGGGASGAAGFCSSVANTAVGGGGGGYTATAKNQNISGKKLVITIGAGGNAVTISSGSNVSGKNGGTTTITANGSLILSAAGGYGGRLSNSSNPSGNGGSGGGYSGQQDSTSRNGGSDGSDGVSGVCKGQGTTTRAFGESSGTLYSGAGGGAKNPIGEPSTIYTGTGGSGGGGSGQGQYDAVASGGPATYYGGGGGAVLGANGSTSGKGYQGLVRIRWGVAA